jgi:hypothetical protein
MTAAFARDQGRVACRLALTGVDGVTPVELLRLCRDIDPVEGGTLYRALLRDGALVPVQTPFGPRLGVTGRLVALGAETLRADAPAPSPVARDELPFACPTLAHDLLTLAAFIVREPPRVTGRGLLAAPALRRLEGLGLTPDAVAPLLDRRSLPGTRVWQFLFHFLCAQDLVRLEGGRAIATSSLLADSVVRHADTFALLLFTFSAARRPVGDSAWLNALEAPLPASWERRRLAAWLGEAGVRGAEAAVERTSALLDALGLGRQVGPHLVLLPTAAALWGAASDGAGAVGAAPPPPATFALPGGAVAVDLAAGPPALTARLAFEHEAPADSTGQVLIYETAARRGAGERAPRVTIRLGAVIDGDDPALVGAVAEAMAPSLVGRWRGGFAVEILALEETAERLGRLGAAVERRAPGGRSDDGCVPPPPPRTPSLPWTLERAREGVWASGGSGAFRPLRSPAAFAPAAAAALPSPGNRLRAAAALGWPVRTPGGGRPALVEEVRWEAGEERAGLVWLDADGGSETITVAALAGVQLADIEEPAADAGNARG